MSFETLLLDRSDGIATITINRPEKRNALSAAVRRELVAALDAVEADTSVRVVVLTGAGEKAFVAGADIAEFAERTPIEQREAMEGRRVFDVVASLPKPVLAAINGFALGGGCELALACDIRLAARSARLGQPEVNLAILPGGGGTQRLPRLVGHGTAMRLILTGELIDAAEAHRIGLVDEVVDDGALAARARELAGSIARHSPVALKLIKQSVRAAAEMPLSAGLALERELFITAFSSEDRVEGVRAFLEKRTPNFEGR
ncbi:MAG: enoyl-CoA hydratase/isomerase family protein [Gemmatimonadetes bacterium]|nr:enoyl-CoA hydratase/isomerase family protein [Gemmatimonadota bacterium]